jgi:hypothetical protein
MHAESESAWNCHTSTRARMKKTKNGLASR